MNIQFRNINKNDFNKGYLTLIQNLSNDNENISYPQFEKYITNNITNNYKIYVIEDLDNKKIIGSITLMIEEKLIHNLGFVAHIEDVIVDPNYQKMGLASKLINLCITKSRKKGCYKIILNCKDELTSFYNKFDFCKNGNLMRLNL
jgi:glucosamine-phosphate N-acetyltransferase